MYLLIWYVVWGQKNKIEAFHPQSRDDFIAVTYAAKILRKKIIWIDHADLKNIYANNKIWYKNPVGKWVFRASKLADKVVLESESEAKLIEVSLGRPLPTNYTVIHIGVVDSYRPLERKPGKVVLVATSRLVKAKGIGELIEAFGLIDGADAALRLYGEGPDGDYFKSLALDAKNIEFMGHVDGVTEALQNADIFVHPTYHEGFGLSLVEAEMCSLPIIASNIGSIPEIVEDGVNGILVPVKDVAKLAEAMKTLIENSDQRVKMGQASRHIYLKGFQFDKIVKEKFLPLYE
jgi:glycosyltransferase involved in cell wall biosynthesis